MKMNLYQAGIRLLTACCFLSPVPMAYAQVTPERAVVIPASPEEARQQDAIFSFLQAYFSALAKGEVENIARYHPSLTPAQLDILRDYFAQTIRDLHIALQQVRVSMVANTATVSFYRTDLFVDRPTNRPVKKGIYLSTTLVQGVNGWQLAGLDQVAFALGHGKKIQVG